MIESRNWNLEKTEPDYFYLVRQFVTTFQMDEGNNEPYCDEQKFEGKDLLKCKTEAEKCYWEKLGGLAQRQYFFPFAAPQNFEEGKNAAFSVTLLLVEYYNEDEYFEYPLIGEDDETTAESKEIETAVLKEKGLL